MQCVGIATPPADYVSRLIPMFRTSPWSHLQLFALDATDLALSKLERMRPGITRGLLPLQRLVELVDDGHEAIALSRRHSGALRTEHFGKRISRFP